MVVPVYPTDEVQASTRETLDRMKPLTPRMLYLMDQAVMAGASTGIDAHRRLRAITDQATALVAPYTPCTAKCDKCCHMAVGMSDWEARVIAKACGLPFVAATIAPSPERDVAMYTGVVCPFLVDHSCSIYAVRPLACRTHFNLSKYPELCDIEIHPNGEVPNLNWTEFWFASAKLCLSRRVGYADIRSYFSGGAANCTGGPHDQP